MKYSWEYICAGKPVFCEKCGKKMIVLNLEEKFDKKSGKCSSYRHIIKCEDWLTKHTATYYYPFGGRTEEEWTPNGHSYYEWYDKKESVELPQ